MSQNGFGRTTAAGGLLIKCLLAGLITGARVASAEEPPVVIRVEPVFKYSISTGPTDRYFPSPEAAFAAFQDYLNEQRLQYPQLPYMVVWGLQEQAGAEAYRVNGKPMSFTWQWQRVYPNDPSHEYEGGTTGPISGATECPLGGYGPGGAMQFAPNHKALPGGGGSVRWCAATLTLPEPCPDCSGDDERPPQGMGNPLLPEAGYKLQTEVDYRSANGLLQQVRTYRSDVLLQFDAAQPKLMDFSRSGPLDGSWPGQYCQTPQCTRLGVHNFRYFGIGVDEYLWTDGRGKYAPLMRSGDTFQGPRRARLSVTKTALPGGDASWQVKRSDNSVDVYNAIGQRTHRTTADGKQVNYAYANGLLVAATDPFGRTVSYGYDEQGHIKQFIDPAGQAYSYAYDASVEGCAYTSSLACKQLVAVTFPDGTARQYHWNEPVLTAGYQRRGALTGLTDERGIRVGSYGYDEYGWASMTVRAGGVDRYEVISASRNNGTSNGTVTLRDPLGQQRVLGFTKLNGRLYRTSASQPGGSGSAASSSYIRYDANGNVASRDDFKGMRTCYASDLSRNLETTRVEGLGSSASCASYTAQGTALPAGARKISTQWHPDWRLQVQVAEPGKLTTTVYNGQPDPFAGGAAASCAPADALLPDGKPIAVVCKRVEQATTDANGAAGFNATLQAGVPARTWSYTYNRWGQVLSEDGPRTDVADVTTYEYYTDTTAEHTLGDLKQVTNAAGQTTTYTKYNPHGQVLESVDANGSVSVNTYDLRQRLLSSTVGGQTTSYEYEPTGDLKKVTQPDGSWVAYGYDAARRLTSVSDSAGNSIVYTLDNAGNRTKEEVKDPGGALARHLTRVYDALGRVQQTTGRE